MLRTWIVMPRHWFLSTKHLLRRKSKRLKQLLMLAHLEAHNE